ncbi:hypothetical protein BC940DRAFT_295211 [Gongronella butleri]|nr:hypothetical protein BC940DRAFT_295211 [Gongronella butleri]
MKVLAILATLAVAAMAQDQAFYVTAPLKGTQMKAGSTYHMTWLNGPDVSAKVLLLYGTNPSTMSPTGTSFTVQGSDDSYDFKVPSNLSPSGTFAFQFQYADDNGGTVYAYSDAFSVTGGTGTIGAPPSGASSAPVSATSSVVSSAAPSSTLVSSSASVSASGNATSAASSAAATKTTSAAGRAVQWTVAVLVVPALMAAIYA